jgi:hypothetical protein
MFMFSSSRQSTADVAHVFLVVVVAVHFQIPGEAEQA